MIPAEEAPKEAMTEAMMENEAPQKLEEASEQTGEQAQAAPLSAAAAAPQAAPLTLVVPLTREELTTKLEELSARARDAGMSPVRELLSTYARRGMAMLDTFLSSLEDGSSTKKPSDRKD